jgi:AGCS family alanine or glycine:cation symporter
MTSLVLIFTGFHENTAGLEGAPLTSAAFGSVFPWFPYLLVVAILLFAFSTMISWSYYGLKGFHYLFGKASRKLFGSVNVATNTYFVLFLLFTIIGASSNLTSVIQFSDMMVLTLAFPNIIGLLVLAPEVSRDLKNYMDRLRKGEIVKRGAFSPDSSK